MQVQDTGVEFYVYLENPADAQHIFMTLLINDITLVEPLSIYNVTENGEIPTKTWFRVCADTLPFVAISINSLLGIL